MDGLSDRTETVSADSGYESNSLHERIEWSDDGKCTGRPSRARKTAAALETSRRGHRIRPATRPVDDAGSAASATRAGGGGATYRPRRQTVEPFNEWFRSLFELGDRVWHRGLENNHSPILTALFAYQLLVRFNHRGNADGQIRWILDLL